MGDISEMLLGASASDLFERDLRHAVRGEPFEENPDDPKYLPTNLDVRSCYYLSSKSSYPSCSNDATPKQISFAKAISRELGIALPKQTTKESYRSFISEHIDDFYSPITSKEHNMNGNYESVKDTILSIMDMYDISLAELLEIVASIASDKEQC